MTQKIILCEVMPNADILEIPVFASVIADGYDVTSVSGYSTNDNRHMCLVTFTEAVELPVFIPATATFDSSVDVTLYCPTDGATIYYTTDGSTPTAASTAFTSDITVSATTTIKAIAVKNGVASKVASKTYTKNS